MSLNVCDETMIQIVNKFNTKVKNYYDKVKEEFEKYKDKPDLLQCLKKKHSFLKPYRISKKTKIEECKGHVHELFEQEYFSEFSENDKQIIYEYSILKIRGLYKHAQALKTGFCNGQISENFIKRGDCNGQIITGLSEEKTLSVCITKNTLEANEQWLTRLFKELDTRYPQVKLTNKIMIISSKKNDLEGHATHCKNMDKAWSYLKKKNEFKIIFICSNKIRIQDIHEMAVSFSNLIEELAKNIRILHDEAHNTKEGIPPFRQIIENIIILPNVLSYEPITASLGNIVDDKNPIWVEKNLEKYAINFTDFDKTKSDDPKYSSISDYNTYNFEDLSSNKDWNSKIKDNISRKYFIRVDDKYKNKKLGDLKESELGDIDRRRVLEFCQFMKNDKEKEALMNGINTLNLNVLLGFDLYIKDEFNLHICSTPNRKIITYKLCKVALKQSYKPIVLGIYGNQKDKYHLFIKGVEEKCVDDIMGDGEFNCKLHNLIKHLESSGINTKRPFIVIGNYTPTGESLSFVNYEYGTVRSVVRLISTNAEEDYQSACRGNYMNTKFIEKLGSDWKSPVKYLIGHKKFITNSLSYEAENDARIDSFDNISRDTNPNNIVLPSSTKKESSSNGTVAIPIKINIGDKDNKDVKKLIEIASQRIREEDDKIEFLEILKKCCKDEEIDCSIEDKTGKFDWAKMKLEDFRCYKKDFSPPKKGYWKFKNYQNNFITEQPFINNTSNHVAGQCEILICNYKYVLKNKDGTKDINHTTTWWMGYKY